MSAEREKANTDNRILKADGMMPADLTDQPTTELRQKKTTYASPREMAQTPSGRTRFGWAET